MKNESSGARLINNSFYLMLDWVLATVLSMVFWIVVGKNLSTSGYGIVATATNISLLIAAFGMFGLRDVATNMISRYVKRGLIEKARGVIKFSAKFVLIGNIISASVVAIFSPQLADILNLPIETVWLVSVLIFGWGFWIITTGFLQGLQNMRALFKTNLIGQIIKVALPFALFFIGLNFLSPIIAFIVSLLITVFIRIRYLPRGRSSPPNGRELILKLALPVFISSVMWLVFTNMPNVIINAIKSPDITGIFALALTLVVPIVFIPMTLNQALFPITSSLSETRNPQRNQSNLISLVLKFATFITLPLVALLLVFSREIILFFSQPQYLPAAEFLPIVSVAALFLGIGQILVSNIFAIGKPHVTRNITIITTVIFLSLSIPGTFFFSSMGMAFAYLISMILLVVASYLYLRKAIKLKINWAAIGKIFIATMIFSAITFLLNSIFSSVMLKLATIVLGAFAYFIVLVPLKYYSTDETKIIRHIFSRFKFLRGKIDLIEKILLGKL